MDNEAAPPLNPAVPDAEAAGRDLSAGFWLRAGAYMIDGVLIAAVSVLLDFTLPETVSVVARLVVSAAYFTLMTTLMGGQTLGKMAAGIAIARRDGSPLSYGRMFARWFGYLLSTLVLCLGFLCALFTKNKRCLHDYLAGTRVVRVQELGFGRKLAVVLVGVLLPLIILIGIVAAVGASKQAPSGDADVKTRLDALRAAAASYAADSKGSLPADLNSLAPKYIPEIPAAENPDASGVEVYGPDVCSGSGTPGQEILAGKLRDTGKWGYVVAPKAPCDGRIFIDSTDKDSKDVPWYAY